MTPTRPTQHRPPRRRGFTLLEMMLAASLASVVVLSTLSLLFAMRQSARLTDQRAQMAADGATLHRALTQAFNMIVVAPPERANPRAPAATPVATPSASPGPGGNSPGTGSASEGAGAGASGAAGAGSGAGAGARREPTRPPRIALSRDAQTGQARLELAVGTPPVAVRDRDGRAVTNGPAGFMRGALELVPSPARPGESTLIWKVLELPAGEGGVDATSATAALETATGDNAYTAWASGQRRTVGQQTIVTGVRRLDWRFYRTTNGTLEPVTQLESTTSQELPAYAEVQVELASGFAARWVFEIGWMVEPRKRDRATQVAALLGRDAGETEGAGLDDARPTGAGGVNASRTSGPSPVTPANPALNPNNPIRKRTNQ